jgi:hypothetical protein
MNLKTGLVMENASTHRNAEMPDNVKIKASDMVMIAAKRSTSELLIR